MRYLSVCSGIESATVAWGPLGWEAVAFCEIAPFPSAVLAHRFPSVPNLGDFTKVTDEQFQRMGPIGLVVGGTPCQSFSVAGLRAGMRDPRGNLALGFLALADKVRPKWIVWENVPGVLSSNGGRDFGSFLGALGQLGYGWAYRVLDAQYFGVAQRRRRVFVVGCAGDQRSAAEVLFEPDRLPRHYPPSRKTGAQTSATLTARAPSRSNGGSNPTPGHLIPAWPAEVASTLQACYATKCGLEDQHNDSGAPLFVPCGLGVDGELARNLTAVPSATGRLDPNEQNLILRSLRGGVRRITPIEAARLQGFPDEWTRVPYRGKSAEECPDGPQYHAYGNSMAVPVVRWLGERIAAIDSFDSVDHLLRGR